MNAVQTTIREHVDARYQEWHKRAAEPVETRAGTRYLGHEVATLVAPALTAVNLHFYDDGWAPRIFVTSTGKQITRERLRDLIIEALADHPDRVLRESVGSAAFWEHLYGRVPEYAGEVTRTIVTETSSALTSAERVRAHRARKIENERASARAFLDAALAKGFLAGERVLSVTLHGHAKRNVARKVEEAREGYASPFIGDTEATWAVPRPKVFRKVADEVLGERVRVSGGYAYVMPERAA